MVGGSGTSVVDGVVSDLEHNSDLSQDDWRGTPYERGIAAKMMCNGNVKTSLDVIKNPLLAAKWRFRPHGGKHATPKDREVADFCDFAILKRRSFKSELRPALSYMEYGFWIGEVTDETVRLPEGRFPNHPGAGFGVVVTKIHDRPQNSILKLHQSKSDPSCIAGVTQFICDSDEEGQREQLITSDRLIRMTWDQRGADFNGISLIRSAYGPWKALNICRILELIRHERIAVGTPTITLPEGITADDEEVSEAEDILKSIKSSTEGYAILPAGYVLEWSEGGETTNIDQTIRACKEEIAANTLSGFMTLGSKGTAGSYNLASTQAGQFNISIKAHAEFIQDCFNHGQDGFSIVERIVRMNYGQDVGLPELYASNLPTVDIAALLPLVTNLGTAGGITFDDETEDHMREGIDFPPRDTSVPRKAASSAPIEPPTQSENSPPDEPEGEDDDEEEDNEE